MEPLGDTSLQVDHSRDEDLMLHGFILRNSAVSPSLEAITSELAAVEVCRSDLLNLLFFLSNSIVLMRSCNI